MATKTIIVQPEAQPSTPAILKTPVPKAEKILPEHFLVTIKGQAAITGGLNPEVINYEENIACPNLGEGKADGHYMTYCLRDDLSSESLLSKAIKKRYGRCEAIRTHELVNRVFVDSKGYKKETKNIQIINGSQFIQISQMRHAELEEYVKERGYAIELELYPNAEELRSAVDSYEKNKDDFALSQDRLRDEFRIKHDAEILNAVNEELPEVDI